LVSQIGKLVHAGEDKKRSVVSGFVTSTGFIASAALTMVFVLGSFQLNGHPTVEHLGVSLAVAVILDASVLRCRLLSAEMCVLERKNWHLARVLEPGLVA
jgi:putative drug exporter of the RND superfamily